MSVHAISFVIPLHNERDTLETLCSLITDLCISKGYSYEIILVDDGSDDGGFEVIRKLAQENPNIRGLRFQRNFGQTAAIRAGFRASHFPLIVTLDADLQNDPADVPLLLSKINEGYDVISGVRSNRKDIWFKCFLSRWANRCISWTTGVQLKDFGCTLKLYRREYVEHAPLYGEMHRFIPVLASWYGARIAEVAVHHHQRKTGKSHYGVIGRTIRVLLDLLTVKFLHSYVSRPMHFFGGVAIVFLLSGTLIGGITVLLRLLHIFDFVSTPLPLLTIFLMTIGVIFLLMGLLAELLIRIYFEQTDHHPYRIYEVINSEYRQ